MRRIDEILAHNRAFVENGEYEQYWPKKPLDKRLVIVTCMDARLTELLPKAFNIHDGDAKVIKNAGAIITAPFGNIMRSVIVALYELNANEVVICGHHDCGMTGIDPKTVVGHMVERGIPSQTIKTLHHSGFDFDKWLTGFENVQASVEKSVDIVRKHPLLPPGTPVHGMIIDPKTGALEWVVDGYEYLKQEEPAI
ncbi:beta-class carbonic anhydrase [Cohnella thailandensis]|uniref:carbonic anhydrase n=1 Tax=Cohnella thailandensis TaxID=557557 RepID=A0A841T6I7_9BACL|nr:carbonic anhydrase [Cohnella thailandensis]MBB6638315.1 carbonic anhydrase [Cohnella thailandensis]MBP1977207.1 carbonic anhydrase [Cohnella thailandensis]